MFGSYNANPMFPVFLEENQFHYDPLQLQLFGNPSAACSVEPANYFEINNVSSLNRPSKRNRETEDIARQCKLQISMNNFGQDEADRSTSVPNPNAVSTGLRLSFDDDERNSSVTSASGSIPSLPTIMSLGDNLRSEIDLQMEEFDHYMRVQEEQIAKGVKEMKQRHTASFLRTIEKGLGMKLREKEVEIESMNRKNKELVERIQQVAVEAHSWQYRARYNESVVNTLKNSLKQAVALGADQGKEGCGDSEVDEVSSYNPNLVLTGIPQTTLPGKTPGLSVEMTCKSCMSKEVSTLLLPCRHLCLCEDCEGFIDVCPICRVMKSSSVRVYLS